MHQAGFAQLRAKLIDREPAAYKKLLAECGHYCIHRLVKKTNCSTADAEDILMDAILIFSEKVIEGQILELTSVRAYIYSVCWNRWNELHRRKKRQSLTVENIASSLYEAEQSIEQKIIAAENKKLQEAQYQSEINISRNALQMLGEKCQRILKLYYAQERSMKEIANIMGYANAQTVKNLKSRCYKKWVQLAQQIAESNYGK